MTIAGQMGGAVVMTIAGHMGGAIAGGKPELPEIRKAASVGKAKFRSRTYGTIRFLIAILHRSPGSRTPERAPSMIR